MVTLRPIRWPVLKCRNATTPSLTTQRIRNSRPTPAPTGPLATCNHNQLLHRLEAGITRRLRLYGFRHADAPNTDDPTDL